LAPPGSLARAEAHAAAHAELCTRLDGASAALAAADAAHHQMQVDHARQMAEAAHAFREQLATVERDKEHAASSAELAKCALLATCEAESVRPLRAALAAAQESLAAAAERHRLETVERQLEHEANVQRAQMEHAAALRREGDARAVEVGAFATMNIFCCGFLASMAEILDRMPHLSSLVLFLVFCSKNLQVRAAKAEAEAAYRRARSDADELILRREAEWRKVSFRPPPTEP
jgi:hypothetical protein